MHIFSDVKLVVYIFKSYFTREAIVSRVKLEHFTYEKWLFSHVKFYWCGIGRSHMWKWSFHMWNLEIPYVNFVFHIFLAGVYESYFNISHVGSLFRMELITWEKWISCTYLSTLLWDNTFCCQVFVILQLYIVYLGCGYNER